jgi:hypothetical protein
LRDSSSGQRKVAEQRGSSAEFESPFNHKVKHFGLCALLPCGRGGSSKPDPTGQTFV